MKRLLIKIWHTIKGSSIIIFSIFLIPFAKLFLGHKKIWLITERPAEARDNGYNFYNYLVKNQPQINVVYAIKKNSPDFAKLSGKTVEFGSLKHLFIFCACKYSISSTTEWMAPNSYVLLFQNKIGYPHKNVFLQHGIIDTNLDFLYKRLNNIHLFICGAQLEFDDVSKNYGYSKNEVAYTGLARFDNYFNINFKKQILIMPTWRRGADDVSLVDSVYFKSWNGLINSPVLDSLLKKYDIKLYFYMHPVFQKYHELFNTNSKNIIIADFQHYDVQQLLRESQVLITDFSSIIFDFAYMKKPAIYFQFDTDDYYKNHYKKGYFSYERDGFGYVCPKENDVIEKLEYLLKNDFPFDKKFSDNHTRFFTKYDAKNCERIFKEIIKL